MIKLTNREAAKLLSPVIDRLFNSERTFPVKVAFELSRAVDIVRREMQTYRDHYKKILDKHGAEQDDAVGAIKYPDVEAAQKAAAEIKELDELDVEFLVKPVEIGEDWPELTLIEMNCLSPILRDKK